MCMSHTDMCRNRLHRGNGELVKRRRTYLRPTGLQEGVGMLHGEAGETEREIKNPHLSGQDEETSSTGCS